MQTPSPPHSLLARPLVNRGPFIEMPRVVSGSSRPSFTPTGLSGGIPSGRGTVVPETAAGRRRTGRRNLVRQDHRLGGLVPWAPRGVVKRKRELQERTRAGRSTGLLSVWLVPEMPVAHILEGTSCVWHVCAPFIIRAVRILCKPK